MTLIQKYAAARTRYLKAIESLNLSEAALFVPGTEVRWPHGDFWRGGEVLEYRPGILGEGKVLVMFPSNKKQEVGCSQVFLDFLKSPKEGAKR